MKHERGFWPMAREFEIEDEDLVLRCEPCEGTGSVGSEAYACRCATCDGRGALPLPSSLQTMEVGHG